MSKKTQIDSYISDYIIKSLTTSFRLWPAFKYKIINEKGKILKDYEKLTDKEKEVWSLLDILLCNLKVQLDSTSQKNKLQSYPIFVKNFLTNVGIPTNELVVSLKQGKIPGKIYLNVNEDNKIEKNIIREDEAVPTNNMGSGNVSTFDPPLLTRTKNILKRKQKNKLISGESLNGRLTKNRQV